MALFSLNLQASAKQTLLPLKNISQGCALIGIIKNPKIVLLVPTRRKPYKISIIFLIYIMVAFLAPEKKIFFWYIKSKTFLGKIQRDLDNGDCQFADISIRVHAFSGGICWRSIDWIYLKNTLSKEFHDFNESHKRCFGPHHDTGGLVREIL